MYSQEFVFPSFWPSSGELVGAELYQNFVLNAWKARVVQNTLKKILHGSLLLEDCLFPI